MFKDRIDAGQQLAKRLAREYEKSDAVVLAIPRGGVVVGDQVARILQLPLDIVIPRKIGAPNNPELAIGAVALGTTIINEQLVAELEVPQRYIQAEAERQKREIARRMRDYRGNRAPIDLENKISIIVDDGVATGFTALAAIDSVKSQHPKKTVLAVPVASTDAHKRLKKAVDEIVCLRVESLFFAVGQFYEDFEQTTDAEVVNILKNYGGNYGEVA
jgi:predicted phosphoribosyltransferase